MSRSDVAFLERAVRNQWPIPAACVDGLADRMWQLVLGKDPRIAVRAASILDSMMRTTILAERGQVVDPANAATVHIYIPDNGRDQLTNH